MSPRTRARKNRDLSGIQNLYRDEDGYYTYRHPVTKVVYGLGKNKAKAVAQAVEANMHFQRQAPTLLDRILGVAERTVSDWCDQYNPLMAGHGPRHPLGYL